MISRRPILLVVALAVALFGAPQASAGEPQGVACTFDGVVEYDTDITTTSVDFTYTFAGTLACGSDQADHPGAGTIQAGGTYPIDGVEHILPPPAGHGGCTTSATSGLAVIDWSDGSRSVMSFDTQSVTGAGLLTGRIVPEVTATRLGGGQPAHVGTTRNDGYHVTGSFGFEADATECVTGGRRAGIHGISTLRR